MAALVVLTTVPDAGAGAKLARILVKSGAAVCVNVVPGIHSIYRWKGKVTESREALLVVKAPKKNFRKIEDLIREKHPYELPEVLALSVAGGSAGYLQWLHAR
jgi:periplasmic divalent cation tolerance protein